MKIKTLVFWFFVGLIYFNQALDVKALDTNNEKIYKTVTNSSIIYVAENNNNFDYSWQFDKDKYKDNFKFSLIILDTSPSAKDISKIIGNDIKRQYLFFEHHGNLPADALMKIKVSSNFSDGDKLYLYYYNDVTNKVEFIAHNLMVRNGAVEFKIMHCSDYLLTASIVKGAMDNPKNMAVVIISLIILGVILFAATVFMNSKK